MADDGFITAVPPNGGGKRRVPKHYLDEPFNFKTPALHTEGPGTGHSGQSQSNRTGQAGDRGGQLT
jgi:hypothetical protein